MQDFNSMQILMQTKVLHQKCPQNLQNFMNVQNLQN